MKYLKLFESYNDIIRGDMSYIEDMLSELKDDNFRIDVDSYNGIIIDIDKTNDTGRQPRPFNIDDYNLLVDKFNQILSQLDSYELKYYKVYKMKLDGYIHTQYDELPRYDKVVLKPIYKLRMVIRYTGEF